VTNRLYRCWTRCADSGLPELERLATTVETWWPRILVFIHTGITNAGSEGTNRVIKTIARDAYGFHNPETSGYAPAVLPPDVPVDASAADNAPDRARRPHHGPFSPAVLT
jgi:hypothetical protein